MVKQFQALYWIIKTDRAFSDLVDVKSLGKVWNVPEFSVQTGAYGDYDSSTVENEMLDVCNCFKK